MFIQLKKTFDCYAIIEVTEIEKNRSKDPSASLLRFYIHLQI